MSAESAVAVALGGTALLAAALAIHAAARGHRARHWLFKPLATLLLLALALSGGAAPGERYRLLLAAGLAFSLAGDVFLMLPSDRFVPGLASFLLAHAAYVTAFLGATPPPFRPGPFLPFAAAAALLVSWLGPRLGRLRIPVAIYAAALAAMAGSALARALAVPGPGSVSAAAGAALFVVSDALLGADRFRGPLPAGRTLVLSTYYPAQLLIALSTVLR